MSKPIRVDFQNSDALGRVRLNTAGAVADLDDVELQPGLLLNLCDGELSTEGEVVWNTEEALWVAVVDWDDVVPPPLRGHS